MDNQILLRANRISGPGSFIELHVDGQTSTEHGLYVTLTRERLTELRKTLERLEAFLDYIPPDDYCTWEV